jgi:hypothetical protein
VSDTPETTEIEGVLRRLPGASFAEATPYMHGRLLLDPQGLYFIEGWETEIDHGSPLNQNRAPFDRDRSDVDVPMARTVGSPRYLEVRGRSPAEQIKAVPNSLALRHDEITKASLPWFGFSLKLKIHNGATFSFRLPDQPARKAVKAWINAYRR